MMIYPLTATERAFVRVLGRAAIAGAAGVLLFLALLSVGCGYAAEHWLPCVTGQNSATTYREQVRDSGPREAAEERERVQIRHRSR